MKQPSRYLAPCIEIFSCDKEWSGTEKIVAYHRLVWFIKGETKIIHLDHTYLFSPGEVCLIPRKEPVTIIHYASAGEPNKMLVMHLFAAVLDNHYAGENSKQSARIKRFPRHPLLKSCYASLVPYFALDTLPPEIAYIKITEAISVLSLIDVSIDGLLADFKMPFVGSLVICFAYMFPGCLQPVSSHFL